MGFGKEDHQSKVPLQSITSRVHTVNMTHPIDVDLDHLVERLSVRFPHYVKPHLRKGS